MFFARPPLLRTSVVVEIFDGAKTTNDDNREDFSHCEANVKSVLDEVLRRGSVSVKVEW